jgi:hypothetical protein
VGIAQRETYQHDARLTDDQKTHHAAQVVLGEGQECAVDGAAQSERGQEGLGALAQLWEERDREAGECVEAGAQGGQECDREQRPLLERGGQPGVQRHQAHARERRADQEREHERLQRGRERRDV